MSSPTSVVSPHIPCPPSLARRIVWSTFAHCFPSLLSRLVHLFLFGAGYLSFFSLRLPHRTHILTLFIFLHWCVRLSLPPWSHTLSRSFPFGSLSAPFNPTSIHWSSLVPSVACLLPPYSSCLRPDRLRFCLPALYTFPFCFFPLPWTFLAPPPLLISGLRCARASRPPLFSSCVILCLALGLAHPHLAALEPASLFWPFPAFRPVRSQGSSRPFLGPFFFAGSFPNFIPQHSDSVGLTLFLFCAFTLRLLPPSFLFSPFLFLLLRILLLFRSLPLSYQSCRLFHLSRFFCPTFCVPWYTRVFPGLSISTLPRHPCTILDSLFLPLKTPTHACNPVCSPLVVA